MTPEKLESMLRLWGYHLGERARGDRDEIPDADKTRNHALVRAAQFPPGAISGRAARSMSRLRGSPSWGFDPAVCTETRSHRISVPEDTPREVVTVQAAYERLNTFSPALAAVLLANYHWLGCQADKAEDMGLPLRRYKERLAGARASMFVLMD